MDKHRYFAVYKPYNMVSQFISPDKVRLLGDLDFNFPEGTHAIGRLDNHSEGLLLLTTNKKVTRLLFESEMPHKRTYLVKVKNKVNEERLAQLRNGITLRIAEDDYFTTTPCEVEIAEQPVNLAPIGNTLRPDVPHTWLQITLTEGKYHQVRKMVAAVHHRCRRLIRVAIEDLTLGDMLSGEVKELEEQEFFDLLNITDWRS